MFWNLNNSLVLKNKECLMSSGKIKQLNKSIFKKEWTMWMQVINNKLLKGNLELISFYKKLNIYKV
jgi:hypothetical protein